MSNAPPPATPSTPHLSEAERAIRAVAAGLVLGVVLRLVSRRRSA